ncbi:hypothetical protein D3C81_2081800 [compost metagenome]
MGICLCWHWLYFWGAMAAGYRLGRKVFVLFLFRSWRYSSGIPLFEVAKMAIEGTGDEKRNRLTLGYAMDFFLLPSL